MLYNIKASFIGVLGVGLNAILTMIFFVKLPPVTSLIALY